MYLHSFPLKMVANCQCMILLISRFVLEYAFAGCLSSMGRHAEALPLYNQALEGRLTALGPAHPSTLTSTSNAASCLFNLGDCERALPLFRRAYEGTEGTLRRCT